MTGPAGPPGEPPSRRFHWLDVFSSEALAGNGLAVVLDADGLSDQTMLAFARETGLSETTFVQSPTAEGADYRNRIWTVAGEIPFAGHPSLGTAVAVALATQGAGEEAGPARDAAGGPGAGIAAGRWTFRQQTGVGIQAVEASFEGGVWIASVDQEAADFGGRFDSAEVAAALGLQPGDMDPELSCQIVSIGLPALLAPVGGLDALGRAAPVFEALRALDPRTSLNLYAFVYERGSRTVRARCFGADLAGIEDPATGSAAGPLVAYLQDCLDIDRITVEQGVEMGRPSRIEARMEAGRPKVSGAVTPVASGTIHLP